MDKSEIWLVQAKKRLGLQGLKFDKFCKRKFDKRRILFCAVFGDFIRLFLTELDGYHNAGSLCDFPEYPGFSDRSNLELLQEI